MTCRQLLQPATLQPAQQRTGQGRQDSLRPGSARLVPSLESGLYQPAALQREGGRAQACRLSAACGCCRGPEQVPHRDRPKCCPRRQLAPMLPSMEEVLAADASLAGRGCLPHRCTTCGGTNAGSREPHQAEQALCPLGRASLPAVQVRQVALQQGGGGEALLLKSPEHKVICVRAGMLGNGALPRCPLGRAETHRPAFWGLPASPSNQLQPHLPLPAGRYVLPLQPTQVSNPGRAALLLAGAVPAGQAWQAGMPRRGAWLAPPQGLQA